MVETISPVVYGTRTKWLGALALHAAGAAAAGGAVGGAGGARGPAGARGAPPPAPCWVRPGAGPAP
jgi:hypothetical protein